MNGRLNDRMIKWTKVYKKTNKRMNGLVDRWCGIWIDGKTMGCIATVIWRNEIWRAALIDEQMEELVVG